MRQFLRLAAESFMTNLAATWHLILVTVIGILVILFGQEPSPP